MMKRTNKLWLALLFALLVAVLVAVGLTAAAEETPDIVASGYCGAEGDGTNLQWTLDSEGLFTVSGTGEMKAFTRGFSPATLHQYTLEKVVIEEGVTNIANGAFYRCEKLKSVIMADSVTLIGEDAFEYCDSLQDVTFSENLATIKRWAFRECPALKQIVLPDSVTTIEAGAFYRCSSLKYVTLSAHLQSLEKWLFEGTALETVFLPAEVSSFGENVFEGCLSLTAITVDADNPTFSNDSFGCLYDREKTTLYRFPQASQTAVFEIPACVTTIAEGAFSDCSGLQKVTIPDSVTEIGGSVFSRCLQLREAKLPANITVLPFRLFYCCPQLQEITLPAGITRIESAAFNDCSSLTNVTIPTGVMYLGWDVFEGCTGLVSVDMPDTLTTIQSRAFKDCRNLTNISIPNGPEIIWDEAFSGCTSLKSVTIPDSVTSLFLKAFAGCSSLESVDLPDTLERMDHGAFANCTSLKSIHLPKCLWMYDRNGEEISAFRGCVSLSSIEVDPENDVFYSVDNCMINRNTKTLVLACRTSVIPTDGSVIAIGENAFANAPETITIPGFIQHIGAKLFTGCTDLKAAVLAPGITKTSSNMFPGTVTRIVIPDTVTYIDAYLSSAFQGLEIYYTGSEEQWNQIEIKNYAESYPNNNIIAAPKHFNYQFQQVDAIPSTCREQGFSSGLFCDVTGTWVSGHEALPLADHSFGGWVVTQQPTTDRTGTEMRTCSVCGETETRSIDKLPQPDPQPINNDNQNVFQRIIQWFRDLFSKLFSFFRF